MSDESELDALSIVSHETGKEFKLWESATITSEYLTPCDSFSFEAGAEIACSELAKQFPRGSIVTVKVNDFPQITGYVDKTSLKSGRGGKKLIVSGRDLLSPLVDGNIDPRMKVNAKTTIAELVKLVVTQQFNLRYEIIGDDEASNVQIGSKAAKGKKKKHESRHGREEPIKDIKQKDGEGAFTYLARILGHYGYWLSADPDPARLTIVIGGPDYTQAPLFTLLRLSDPEGKGFGSANNVKDGEATIDQTNVPSHVYVRGSSSPKSKMYMPVASASDESVRPFKPMYLTDKTCTDQSQAERIARFALAKAKRNFFHYDATVAGFSDRGSVLSAEAGSGAIWNVNTVATITDNECGVSGPMWCLARTFTSSRNSGKETKLKFLPLGTLVLDWQPNESITAEKPYLEASKDAGSKPVAFSDGDVTFWEEQG